MDKREFLKTSGAFLTGSLLSHLIAGEGDGTPRRNWAGNYQYTARRLFSPETVEEVQKVVRQCSKAKALGTRHSFDSIADTPGDQISVKRLGEMTLNENGRTVTVGAGVAYGQLAPYLDKHGYALHNLASLPHISVAGACATATHGSGIKNGNLSTAVAGMEMITANGDVVHLSREHDGDRFFGSVVGLGALGVATRMTLKVQPTFTMRQWVYENLPFSALEGHLDEIFSSGYSVSLFTDWQHGRATQLWIKEIVTAAAASKPSPQLFGATLAQQKLHPIAGHSAENCTEQMGVAGPWYERLLHFRMNFTPSSGDELQSEYFVPRERGYQAIRAVEKLRDQITPHLFVTELRTIAADDLWMSPCYRRDSMTIHFTWKPEWTAVKAVLPKIEEELAPFEARPHWAKLFTMAPARLQSLYPKMTDFKAIVRDFDPGGKFRNDFLERSLYGS